MPVYQKKDGRVFCVYYSAGRRIWEPFGRGPRAYQSAEARDLEIKLKKKKGTWQRSTLPGMTFGELAQEYLQTRNIELAGRTMEEIFRVLKIYVHPEIGDLPLNILGIRHWNTIQAAMIRAGLTPGTINKYFHYVSKIFSWAVENAYLEHHPWQNRISLRVRRRKRIDLFTLDEFRRIRRAAPEHVAWIMEVAYYTGIRPGPDELYSLQWKHINWDTSGIHIYSSKTDSWRWQYPDSGFMDRLRVRRDASLSRYPGCPYICSYKGRKITTIKTAWASAKARAGITRRLRLYDIRHFYITYALASGADIMDLAERVGHANGEMIMRVYAHLAKDLLKNQPLTIPDLYQ